MLPVIFLFQLFLQVLIVLSFWQFVVAVLYRPPSSSISFFENLHLALEDLYVTVCSNFYIFGDFNVDVSVPSYLCSFLCNVTCQYSLSIIPTSHMHVTTSSATTIDLMLASSPESVMSCETVPPLGTSDHNGILADVSLRVPSAAPQVSRKFWRYKLQTLNMLKKYSHKLTIIVLLWKEMSMHHGKAGRGCF